MGVRENKVERYLDDQVKLLLGGATRKYVSPQHDGVADRLVFLPGGLLWLVEVKVAKPDGRESGSQERERTRMTKLGFRATIVYGEQQVDELIAQMIKVMSQMAMVQGAIAAAGVV
jgi:hypothetical protein